MGKICKRCNIEKQVTDFYDDKTYKCKLMSVCKECFLKERRAFYATNGGKEKARLAWRRRIRSESDKEIIKAKHKEYYKTMRAKIKYWKASAKRRNINWSITKEQIEAIPKVCYYTGIELSMEPNLPNTISLERIDSSKPYENGNVVFCCSDINRMKQEFSIEYFVETCRKVWKNSSRLVKAKKIINNIEAIKKFIEIYDKPKED
jgi:hypothetical protein